MKVRRESVQARSEMGTRSCEALRHIRAVCRRAERRAFQSQPCIRACSRSLMSIAGYKGIVLSCGGVSRFQLRERYEIEI